MKNRNAVNVERLSKEFRVPHEKVSSLKGHATRMFKRVPVTNYKVLDNINFSIKKGEFFSIIGSNGSGKSTLLKILAGIYEPSSGVITHNGTLTTMIELGVGFNFELSGRDNIFLNASLFGMTRAEVEAVYEHIVEFAELEAFIDQKVKNYSSGMQVRLAFAIAIQAKADIMVVDEVLAVGDAVFQQKCFDVFRELKAMGKTIIFVSHDLQAVQDFSDRVLLLNQSQQVGIFPPLEAIQKYQQLNQTELQTVDLDPLQQDKKEVKKEPEIDKTKPHIHSVSLLDAKGQPIKQLKRGAMATVKVVLNNPSQMPIEAGVSIMRNDGIYCFGTNTFIEFQTVPTAERVTVLLHLKDVFLQKGVYYIVVGVFAKEMRKVFEMRIKAKQFRVVQDDRIEGLVALQHQWEYS